MDLPFSIVAEFYQLGMGQKYFSNLPPNYNESKSHFPPEARTISYDAGKIFTAGKSSKSANRTFARESENNSRLFSTNNSQSIKTILLKNKPEFRSEYFPGYIDEQINLQKALSQRGEKLL